MNTMLSFTEYGYQLFCNDSPVCDYKKSIDDIELVCKQFKLSIPDIAWNGIRSEWVKTNTIEGIA